MTEKNVITKAHLQKPKNKRKGRKKSSYIIPL